MQLNVLLISVCNLSVSSADLIWHKYLVSSSAKIKGIANLIWSGKSLIKIMKSKGPSTLPWGTPDSLLHRSENESPTLTHTGNNVSSMLGTTSKLFQEFQHYLVFVVNGKVSNTLQKSKCTTSISQLNRCVLQYVYRVSQVFSFSSHPDHCEAHTSRVFDCIVTMMRFRDKTDCCIMYWYVTSTVSPKVRFNIFISLASKNGMYCGYPKFLSSNIGMVIYFHIVKLLHMIQSFRIV